MNINLGAPYEVAIKRIIEKEELMLVHKAVEIEMDEIETGRSKTYSFKDIKKIIKR